MHDVNKVYLHFECIKVLHMHSMMRATLINEI